MKKLALKVEELEVSSFETANTREERGTVRGAMMPDTGYWFCFATLVCSDACPDPT